MKLDRVTITGADDRTDIAKLIELSERFPFVEWGILISRSSEGAPRYPSQAWIKHLQHAARHRRGVQLSLHICGHWVRQLLMGVDELPFGVIDGSARVQLNFHAQRTPCKPHEFYKTLRDFGLRRRQFIFQIDGAFGNKHLETVYELNHDGSVDAVPLFDVSGGAGILPASWPKPFYMKADVVEHVYHGYAGGLGPDNLEEQIPLIAAAAAGTRFWIDMETGVRSDNDRVFDLAKVERCLEIADHFIQRARAVPAPQPQEDPPSRQSDDDFITSMAGAIPALTTEPERQAEPEPIVGGGGTSGGAGASGSWEDRGTSPEPESSPAAAADSAPAASGGDGE